MPQEGPRPAGRRLRFERTSCRQSGEGSQGPERTIDRKSAQIEFLRGKLGEAATGRINGCKKARRSRDVIVDGGSEKLRANLKQCNTPSTHPCRVGLLIQEGGPTVFQPCEIASFDTARKELFCRSLQPRFGRHLALVEFPKPLTPPGELDRGQRGLRRSRDDIRHRLVDIQQCIERGAKVGRPVKPDEVPIAQITDR